MDRRVQGPRTVTRMRVLHGFVPDSRVDFLELLLCFLGTSSQISSLWCVEAASSWVTRFKGVS